MIHNIKQAFNSANLSNYNTDSINISMKEESSKERILSSGAKLFARKGFATVGMRELAEDADVNLAMINYFFGSKKGLLKEILDYAFTDYLTLMEEELRKPLSVDEKVTNFIHRAVAYIRERQDYMSVFLAELPHDDPDIIEYKATWAKKSIILFIEEICIPIQQQYNCRIPPAAIGPPLVSMMFSRFLFQPIMEEVKPPGYNDEFFDNYPDYIAIMFLGGLHNLAKTLSERN